MSPALITFGALVRKDLETFLLDRRALVVSVVTPILIAAFFGSLFGGDGQASLSRVPVALVDEDASELSRALAADLAADGALAVVPLGRAEAERRVLAGKLGVAVVLPRGFGHDAPRALFGGSLKPAVLLYYDPSQGLARPLLEGLLTQHVMERVSREVFSATGSPALVAETLAAVRANPGIRPATVADLSQVLEAVRRLQAHAAGDPAAAAGGTLEVPFSLSATPLAAGPRYNGYAHSFAGMSVQFILFMGIDAGVALLVMRQTGVWRRLSAAPVSRAMLLGARVAGTTLVALVILALVYLAAALCFGVRISGSVAGFALVAVAFAVLAATMGLMIAALGRSVAATRGIAMLVVLLLVMLGGAWVPSFVFPEWLQQVALVMPTRWAVDGLDAVTWRGQPFAAALLPAAVLAGFAALCAAVALARFDDRAG